MNASERPLRRSGLATCLALGWLLSASAAAPGDPSLRVEPSVASFTFGQGMEFRAFAGEDLVSPDWSVNTLDSLFPIEDGGIALVPFAVGEATLSASHAESGLADGSADITVRSNAAFVIQRARLKQHADDASKSKLRASGLLELGVAANSEAPVWPYALLGDVTFQLGDTLLELVDLSGAFSNAKQRAFSGAQGLVLLRVTPDGGSSRARFKLSVKGQLAHDLDAEGLLTLRLLQGGFFSGVGEATLTDGRFALRKQPDDLAQPDLYLKRFRLKVTDDSEATLNTVLGASSFGEMPLQAPDVGVCVNGQCFEMPSEQFVAKGARWVGKGAPGALTRVVVDYARRLVTLRGKQLAFTGGNQGSFQHTITLRLGDEWRMIGVALERDDNLLRH